MERAPLEILEYIFSLACTDHGETGRALSAVSRYVRAASARYKHQSIVVRTPEHLKAFTQLLKRASPELRRVGSLVLSSQPACTFNTGAGKQTLYGVQKPALYPSCLRAEIAAPVLLRVIAPTLRTLDLDLAAFSVLRRMHISAPSIIVFPVLQELHIAGDGRSVGLRLGNFFHNFAFPVLLRLGVQGAFPDMDLRQLALAAPLLQECVLVGWTVSLDLPLVFHPLITSDKTGKFPYRVILHVARPSPLTIAYVHALSVHEQVVGQLKALACASGNTLAIVQH